MSRSTSQQKRLRNKRKIRSVIFGTEKRPRLSVFRSNNFLYAQLIDDNKGITLLSINNMNENKLTKLEASIVAGKKLAEAAKKAGFEAIVFDRNGFKYAGRVKAFADACRENGLKF